MNPFQTTYQTRDLKEEGGEEAYGAALLPRQGIELKRQRTAQKHWLFIKARELQPKGCQYIQA
jgi:hypothetical protein